MTVTHPYHVYHFVTALDSFTYPVFLTSSWLFIVKLELKCILNKYIEENWFIDDMFHKPYTSVTYKE